VLDTVASRRAVCRRAWLRSSKETATETRIGCYERTNRSPKLKSHPDWRPHVPFLHRTLNIQTEDYEKNVAPIEEAADTATDKRIEATYAVFDTVPTTLAGMRAKIDFAGSVDHITETLQQTHDPERLKDFLETLYECAARLAA
jgi:hypothetical protein